MISFYQKTKLKFSESFFTDEMSTMNWDELI